MKPFFRLYGAKHAQAKLYGPPRYKHVIEACAGSAAYVTLWEPRQVTLFDRDEKIVEILDYLISVRPNEIMRLPTDIEHLDELKPWVPRPAKNLIGFWFNRNPAVPAAHRSTWARNPNQQNRFWGRTIQDRIARQVELIRHWKARLGSYGNC